MVKTYSSSAMLSSAWIAIYRNIVKKAAPFLPPQTINKRTRFRDLRFCLSITRAVFPMNEFTKGYPGWELLAQSNP